MNTVTMSGNDTVTLNNYLFTGLADQNAVEIDFEGDIANVRVGKNGNAIYGLNESGNVATLKWRVLRGSADDKFLNNLLVQQQANFSGFPLMQGSFIKKLGDGLGNVTSDIYILGGGIFQKIPGAKTNTEGDVDQSISVYTMKFSNAPRAISG